MNILHARQAGGAVMLECGDTPRPTISSKFRSINLLKSMTAVIDKIKTICWKVFYTIKNFIVRAFFVNTGKVFYQVKHRPVNTCRQSDPNSNPIAISDKKQLATFQQSKQLVSVSDKKQHAISLTSTEMVSVDDIDIRSTSLDKLIEQKTKAIVGDKEYNRVETALKKGCYIVGYFVSVEQEKKLYNLPVDLLFELQEELHSASKEDHQQIQNLITELRCKYNLNCCRT